MVTNPAVRHGTDLLKYIFSFVIIASPSFRWFWGPPTQNHRLPCYRCLFVAYPAATDSIVLFTLFFCILFLHSADGKLLLTCTSTWTTHRCGKKMWHAHFHHLPSQLAILFPHMTSLFITLSSGLSNCEAPKNSIDSNHLPRLLPWPWCVQRRRCAQESDGEMVRDFFQCGFHQSRFVLHVKLGNH